MGMYKYQHYSPQTHLKKFNDGASQIYQYDKIKHIINQVKVSNICGKNHLWSIEGYEGEKDTCVEKELGKIDDVYNSCVENLKEGIVNENLVGYLAFLVCRHPHSKEISENFCNDVAKRVLNIKLQSDGCDEDISNWEVKADTTNVLNIKSFLDRVKPLEKIFSQKPKIICHLGKKREFILGDPAWIQTCAMRHVHAFYGVSEYSWEYVFPLTNKLGIILGDLSKEELKHSLSSVILGAKHVSRTNRNIFKQSERFVYSGNLELLEALCNRFSCFTYLPKKGHIGKQK